MRNTDVIIGARNIPVLAGVYRGGVVEEKFNLPPRDRLVLLHYTFFGNNAV